MATLNKVFLIGNLTRDPELRVTPKGTTTCQFGLAINRQFKDEAGQTRDDVTFVDCDSWGKTAEIISKYLSKGSPAMVEGRLKYDQWEDKQSGQKRSKLKVVVENVQFLGQRAGGGEGGAEGSREEAGAGARSSKPAASAGQIVEEEVPF